MSEAINEESTAEESTNKTHPSDDVHIPIKGLRLNNDVQFTIGAPDPNTNVGFVDSIRQTPQGFMVEVHLEIRNPEEAEKHDATHRVNLYIINHSAIAWVYAGDLYMQITEEDV